MSNSIWDALFLPAVWQTFTVANFTPWVAISLNADLLLFNLNPRLFYLHHLISLICVAMISYVFLRQWCTRIWSGYGVVLLLSGASIFVVVNQLMTRHYLEGLFFFIFSLFLFRKSAISDRLLFAVIGAFFYFLAMSAKEIYVMLIVAVFFWPEGDLKKRIKLIIPYSISLIAYIGWRMYILGWHIGGYESLTGHVDLSNFFRLGKLTANALVGEHLISLSFLTIVFLILLLHAFTQLKLLVFASASLIALFFPIVPVINFMGGPGRYFLLIWWSLSICLTIVFSVFWNRHKFTRFIFPVTGILFFLVVIINTWKFGSGFQQFVQQHETVGRHVWSIDDPKAVYFVSETGFGSWYLAGLIWMKVHEDQSRGPMAILADHVQVDDLVKSRDFEPLSLWKYDQSEKKMKDVSSSIIEMTESWRKNLRSEALEISLKSLDGMLAWNFGPHKNGTYKIISKDKHNVSGSFYLPPSGARRAAVKEKILFRLKYYSPEHWYTYSPWLQYDPIENTVLTHE